MDFSRVGLGAGILSIVACGVPRVADRTPPEASASLGVEKTATHGDRERAESPDGDGGAPASADVPMDWGTRPTGNGPLFAVADGMCVHAQIFPVETGAIFTYGNGEYINWETSNPTWITTAFVDDGGITPDPGRGFGAALDAEGGTLTTIGGEYPEHLFAVIDFASRAAFARELRVGSAKAKDWRTILGTNSHTPVGDTGMFVAVSKPIGWSDGAYLFATSSAGMRNGLADDAPDAYAFRVLQRDGTLVPKAKVPGPDLGEAAFRVIEPRAVARLASGEVVGVGYGQKKKLVRWSPSKAVDDVPFPVKPKGDPMFRGGKNRAVIALDDGLYIYDGGTLAPAKANSKLAKGFAWTIGPDDEIIVIQPTGAVLEESANGALHEEALPFAATFDGVPSGVAWGIAKGRGNRGSDALVRKTASGWEVVEIPAPPFGSDLRAPLKVASIVARDATDVFVIVQRSEVGYGWKKPASFRAVYRTRRPREVVRCQDVRNAWTGSGTHRWAPAADDACKTPVVVASFGASAAKEYPTTLAASLRGKTQFGETLSFVTFEGRGTTNLAIVMTDTAKARGLATHLSSLDLRAEVSCGRPPPVRAFRLDVAKGTFSK